MTPFIVSALLAISPVQPRVMRLERAIYALQPHVNPDVASQLARSLYYWSKVYHVDPFVSVAIGFQESSLLPGRIGATGDVGIFQVHNKTIRNYHLDPKRLRNDIDYMVQAHMLILADKMSICRGHNGYSCYHSFTRVYRRQYEKGVSRFMKAH